MWTKIRSTWPDNDRHLLQQPLLLIFEEKWPNYASGPKSAPNSDLFWVRRLFNVCVHVFCAPNATILLVYLPAKIKMSFTWKDDFFLPKSASSVSRSQVHLAKSKRIGYTTIFVRRKDKTNFLSNQTWVLPFTKKKLDGGPYICM